jgi:molybdate transport system ATP-binding protein
MPDTLVRLDDIHFSYRLEPALRIDRWRWCTGERWAVVGGNGAGKTTLARLLCDELRPQRGTIRWAQGFDPERDVLYVSFDLQKTLMAWDDRFDDSETREDARDTGTTVGSAILRGAEADARFEALVAAFGIGHILDRGIRFISTGEGRRTLLARALFARPKLLILDNPLEGLDRDAQRELGALIEGLLGGDTPLLLLLPDGAALPAGISHVLHLEKGAVIASGPRAGVPLDQGSADIGAGPLPPPLQRSRPHGEDAAPIEMRGVGVSHGDQIILNDIHWTFARGRHCHISGPNGAGKSTLLSLIDGDSHKAYGQPLWLFGRRRGSGESVWEVKANCGVVNTPLQLNHVGRQRVLEVVASGLYDTVGLYRNCTGREKELTLAWVHAVGLDALAKHRFDQLSFGEQRLALLARAMVKSPPLLILDEPCIGLDGAHRRQFLALVDRIAAQGYTQVLYVSHEAGELPECINQRLQLVPHPDGGYTAAVSESSPAQ